jgi:predicted permease
MRKAPAVTAIAIVTLALGIGATTTIFTVVNAILLKPLDYYQPDRLVRISGGATLARYDLVKNARTLSSTGAFLVVIENVALAGTVAPDALHGARVTSNFLGVLAVSPLLGRGFFPSEETPGEAVAIISAELWHRRFNADPYIIGKTVRLDAAPCTIVGVLPAGFSFPFTETDVWRPLQPATMPPQTRQHSPFLNVFGRLRDGVTLSQVSAEMDLIKQQYSRANPSMLDAKRNHPEPVVLFHDQLVRNIRPTLWMLFGAVSCVLLIACANVAGLLLARATSRSREFAIRTAIGASRSRIVGQLLAESVLLAIAGGALGVLLTQFGVHAIRALPQFDVPRVASLHLDTRVLFFAIVLSIVTTLLFGLTPSLSASNPDVASVIKGVSQLTPGRLRLWRSSRGLLVTAQISLSTVLVIGAALLLQTLVHLRSVDLGFKPVHLLTMQLSLSPTRYPTAVTQARFFDELVRGVEALPGIRNAAVTITLPTTGWVGTPVHPAGQALPKLNERPIAILQAVTPGYFRTLGIPLERGRDFERRDAADSPLVAVINQHLARRFWPAYPSGENPVGKYMLAGASLTPLQIVGIVADVRQSGLTEAAQEAIYRPRTQTPPMPAMFAVRTEGDPLRAAEAIRRELAAIDQDQAISAVRSMEDVVERSEGQRRSIALLLACFAGIGLLLAVVGVYGVIAYLVTQRTREMGIRRALGAQPADVLMLVLRQGLGLALSGAGVGLAVAAGVNRALRSLVFGVSTLDLSTYIAATIVVVLLTLAATFIPARGATRINPAEALRTS